MSATTEIKPTERPTGRGPVFSKAALALLPANATVRASALEDVTHAMAYR